MVDSLLVGYVQTSSNIILVCRSVSCVSPVFLLPTKLCTNVVKLNPHLLKCSSVSAKVSTLADLEQRRAKRTQVHLWFAQQLPPRVQPQNTNSKYAADISSCVISLGLKTPSSIRCRTIHCRLDSKVQDKAEGPSSISGPGG